MLFAVVLVVAMMAVLIFSLTANLRWEEEWLVGGSTVKREEFEPVEIRVLPYPYAYALEETNRQLEAMEWGGISTIDPDSSEFEAHLILDHERGNVMYWSFYDGTVEVEFDAYSGEIIGYQFHDIHDRMGPGNLSKGEAAVIAAGIADQFSPIPSDASEPWANRSYFGSEWEDDGGEMPREIAYYHWRIEYYRWVDGDVNSSDTIIVLFLEDGSLWWYWKQWWLDMDKADPEYTVTKVQAMVTAIEHTDHELTVYSCEQRVVRPNNKFGERKYYGTPPLYVWEVLLYEDGWPELIVYVHPRLEDTVVGGYEYI